MSDGEAKQAGTGAGWRWDGAASLCPVGAIKVTPCLVLGGQTLRFWVRE
ncbi:hypothetical protein ACVPSA_18065 [Salmonella enterica subsp. enterica serovar Enteritidis]